MSWSIKKFGKRQNVSASVAADPLVPNVIKAAIVTTIDALPERHYDVESFGHIDSTCGNITIVIKAGEQV